MCCSTQREHVENLELVASSAVFHLSKWKTAEANEQTKAEAWLPGRFLVRNPVAED